MYKITPSVQYVFYQVPHVSPYIGAFYRRTYIDNLSDLNSAGGRAGVYIAAGQNAHGVQRLHRCRGRVRVLHRLR